MQLLNSDPNSIFLGQSTLYKGNALFGQVKDFPKEKRVECPISEEWQTGHALGMALTGKTVISMYPRFNFLLLAMGQLCLGIDKIHEISRGKVSPKVILKVICGSSYPLFPGKQHVGDYSSALKLMLEYVEVRNLIYPQDVYPAYEYALNLNGPIVLVEHSDFYRLEI
ncbi:MAG: hypothetical protein ACHQ1D_01485 [Nitrososphaerales archaeon]